jgi:hypothetical protein
MLEKACPPGLKRVTMKYLDSAGLLASITNKMILRQRYPTSGQIRFWDKILVPVSKFTDMITGYQLGKTLVAIWKKAGS